MIYRITKRAFDFICALIGIIVTSPLWIIAIVGILASDWGPIFYTAHRIGKGNKPFKMYKFRSMRVLKAPKKGAEASRPVAQDQFDLFRTGKWNLAAEVPVGLSGPAALYDFIYGDQFTDEKEYMEKVFETRRELEYVYVKKKGLWYDAKMFIYTFICIFYAVIGKECTWILNELRADAHVSEQNHK